MSARFSRNQRRRLQHDLFIARAMYRQIVAACAEHSGRQKREIDALKAQLAETGAALNAERGNVFRLATGEELWTIPETSVVGFRDLTEADKYSGGMIKRECEVALSSFTMTTALADALRDRWRKRELVSFRGMRWAIDQIEATRSEAGYSFAAINCAEDMRFTVRLSAIGEQRK